MTKTVFPCSCMRPFKSRPLDSWSGPGTVTQSATDTMAGEGGGLGQVIKPPAPAHRRCGV